MSRANAYDRIKDTDKYHDISWLMPSIDLLYVLDRLGIEVVSYKGGEALCFCPDHQHFTGREPSHPKWSVNSKTGETICMTEGRGSNLVWTACRLLKVGPDDAVKFMLGSESDVSMAQLELSRLKSRIQGVGNKKEESKKSIVGMEDVEKEMESGYASDEMYDFFMSPPKKEATNIRRETVEHYKVFERTWGYYSNRAIVPVIMKGILEGFCAIDFKGVDAWLQANPDKDGGDYKKVLYPLNFKAGSLLFGYDDCVKRADELFILEGAREKMKLYQEGFPNSVAIFGTNFSAKQKELVSELAPKKIVLLFDGDPAGYDATEKIASSLSQGVFKGCVKKAMVPLDKDPKNLCHDEIRKIVNDSETC